jgi:hypothetical protein
MDYRCVDQRADESIGRASWKWWLLISKTDKLKMRPCLFGCTLTMALIVSHSNNGWAFDPSELVIGTDDLYGFTSGSDIGDARARAVGIGSTWALGKSAGRYRAGATNFDFRYNISDDLQIGLAAQVDSYSIHNVPDLANQNFSSFGGVTPSLRYRIIERSFSPGHPTKEGSPFGLTLSLEPTIGLFDTSTGEHARRTGIEARLALDGALVPSHLFGAVNLSYEASRVRPLGFVAINAAGKVVNATDPDVVGMMQALTKNESTLGLSAAITYQPIENYFIGAEARYRRAYEGLGLQSLAGQALFIGPTFFVNFGGEKTLSIAWSSQVAGRAVGSPGNLDLDNFSRHEAKIAVRVGF